MNYRRTLSAFATQAILALACVASSYAQTGLLKVDITGRAKDDGVELATAAYKSYAKSLSSLTARNRANLERIGALNPNAPYFAPAIVRIYANGQKLPTGGRGRAGDLTLVIDSSFNSAGDPTRAAFLQATYDNAKATMDAVFGAPAISGTVNVVNIDTTIGDRQAITGGFYLPNNGSGGREIRMQNNISREAAAVNLIHCLFLAYLPDPAYGFDGYLEGAVRAATAKVARIPAAMPGLDSELIESVLENTYEVGAFYDWFNQKSLGGPRFIASNLINPPIAAGTLGGIFLVKYRMSGSAWQKVLAEYPTFIRDLNSSLQANPSAATDGNALEILATNVLASYGVGSTLEGLNFNNWVRRQYILETRQIPGTKLHIQTVPITSGLVRPDFGVFNIEATFFNTEADGTETLLSGTSYPIFWDRNYNRILPSADDERMDIVGSYDSVTPNFTDDNAGIAYRVAIDIPVQDRNVRTYIPVGSIATPTSIAVSDFYGSVVGYPVPAGGSLVVQLQIGSFTSADIPVTDYAFGTTIGTSTFLGSAATTIKLISKSSTGARTELLSRRVNKGPGGLALTLGDSPVSNIGFANNLQPGIQLVGFSGDPLRSSLTDILSGSFLGARYNPNRAQYDFFPATGMTNVGQAYFVRVPVGSTPSIPARVETNTALAVALRPGWNMISVPINSTTPFDRVEVVKTTDFPKTYLAATGQDTSDTAPPILGVNVFQFIPGTPDPASGVPEGGTFVAATTFEPGQGYFVRCLASEGVTMLFRPANSSSFSPSRTSGAGGSSQASSLAATRPFNMRVNASGNGEQSFALLGQATGATTGFDTRFDSGLPPSIGGFQVAVLNGERRYKDIRQFGVDSTYRVMVYGCQIGKTYTLMLDTLNGFVNRYEVLNRQNNRKLTYNSRKAVLSFTATTKDMAFDLTLRGVR